jgi:hypothetical protein
MSKQFASWGEVASAIELVGPGGWQHGWKSGGPTAADHDKAAKLHTAAAAKAKSPAVKAAHVRRARAHAQIARKLRSLAPAPAALAYDWDELARVIDLVGPKGYIHGWIFVGIPGAGQKVTLGSGKNRTGTVERADATHLHVRMADGSVTAIPHHGNGKGQLAKVPTAVPQYSSTRAGRDQLSKALVAVGGAAPSKASTVAGKRTQTELLARAVSAHPQLSSDEVLGEHVAGMRASLDTGDVPSFDAHRDAVEARIRQHGMMPAGDLKATAPKGGKRAAGNDKQLSLLGERVNGPDKTSGLMKAGDTQEGYQAIGQAPNGIVDGASDPWWMAGPGGTFALSVRSTSGSRRIVPWSSGKQQEKEADALKATARPSGGSNLQRALAKTATARALHEAAPLNPSAPRPGGPEATAARKVAENVRFEPGLTRGQKEEAEQRLYKAANHLDAGKHEEAASELDATMHATSLRGGAVIKGSTAAQARDLRDKVRGKALSTPALTADGLNMTGAAGGRRAQKAALAQASLADLKAVDAENAHRAALLGKPGQVSATHQLVKNEIAARRGAGKVASMSVTWRDIENALEFSAKTAALEQTPALYGKPGGPGLYGVAGNKHSDYFEQVVKGLMTKRGMGKGQASAVAWGVLRKWAHGGGGVHPEVAAAASKALAQESAASAKAHAHAVARQDAAAVELASSSGRHVAGTDYEWEHNYVPLTHAAAAAHFGGKVPEGWKAPSGGGKTAGKTEPDLSNLPPEPKVPGRDSVNDWSLKSMGGYLDAKDRNDAWQHASNAGKLQKSGAGHQKVMQALAAAEQTAPKSDRAFHAGRLDAYASAHGLKGWYRHTSPTGGGKHMVQVNKIRTPADGERGRYYASTTATGGSAHVVDRDTGKIVARVPGADAAKDWIGKAEAKAQQHAVTWADVARVLELSSALDFGLIPGEPRVPAGSATAGQFSAGTAAQPAAGQQPAKGKQPAKPLTAAQKHALHVAHVAHEMKVSTAKAGLLVTAQDDRQKADALIKQRDALAKALASAGGKVSTGQAGAKTSTTATTKTTAPATAASTSTAAPATASTAKSTTAAKAPAAPAKAGSAAAMKAQIASLDTQITALQAAAATATAQAAKIK